MSILETIDTLLLLAPESSRYSSLKSFLESTFQTTPQDLQKSLDIHYLEKKIDSIEDLTLFSLLYRTLSSFQSKKTSNSYLYTTDNEKYHLNMKLRDRFKVLKEKKLLKKAFFTDVIKDFSLEKLELARKNIKILYQDLIIPMFPDNESSTVNFSFLGKVFLEWGLILEASFEKEDILLVIDVMKLSMNPKIYQNSSWWYMDYEKLWSVFKTMLKVAGKRPEFVDNLQVFFEVIAEEDIKKIVRDVWDNMRGFMTKEETIIIQGLKRILQVAFTKKTLRFLLEIERNLKKNEEVKLMMKVYQEIVLEMLLDKLKGAFFDEVLEILKQFLFSFIRVYMLKKEEWEKLLSNFSFLAQEMLKNKDNNNKIKEFHELLFALSRCYTLFFEKDAKVQNFEKKSQIETFLGRIRRIYAISEPSQYLLEYNYEKLMFSENNLKVFEGNHLNNIQKEPIQRDFAQLFNTGFICYMNAFLQSLYATLPFKEQIFLYAGALNANFPSDPSNLLINLHQLFETMKKSAELGSLEQIKLSEFKKLMPEPFNSSKDQQDTIDFGRALLDDIEKKTKGSALEGLIEKLFTCEIAHRYECQECGNASENIDKAVDFPLSFSQESMISETREHDFKEMMRNYMKNEELTGENKYDCAKCGKKTELTIKRSKWHRLPQILIIRANRFKNSNNLNKMLNKISIVEEFMPSEVFPPECFVFPQNLNEEMLKKDLENQRIEEEIKEEEIKEEEIKEEEIKEEEIKEEEIKEEEIKEEKPLEYIEEENNEKPKEIKEKLSDSFNSIYSLYCIIIHKGQTVKEGHYFTFVKDFRDNAWFCIDDRCAQIEKRDLEYDFAIDETPYIFYYMRKNA